MSKSETIRGLIVNEALLQGERQLLRDRNPSQQDMRGEPAPPAAPPISHSDKTMAPVLLTLLDEQLNGTIVDEASRMGVRPGEISSSANSVAARYAEDDRVFRADAPASSTALPHGQNYPHIAQTVPSTDLQVFLQRFLIGKTRNTEADARALHGPEPGHKAAADPASVTSIVKIAGIALGVTAAVIVIAVRYFK